MAERKMTIHEAKKAFNKIECDISRASTKIIDRDFELLIPNLVKFDNQLTQLEMDISSLKRKEVVLKCINSAHTRILRLIKKVYHFNPPNHHSDNNSDQKIPEHIELRETFINTK